MLFSVTLLLSRALVGDVSISNKGDLNARHPPPIQDRCSPSYLQPGIQFPESGKILNLVANSVQNIAVQVSNSTVNFCNITVTYTHPGWNDTINIYVGLPISDWNGRFQGVGGGGWATGTGPSALLSAIANNYSAGDTDGGHVMNLATSASWAYTASGKLNIPLFIDFASVALNDLAVIGKQLSNRFYGYGPKHAYWNGCSTGGRQGLMMAQRYPSAYDGIYAGSPAINWPTFQVAQYWGQFIMNQLNHYPPSCVFDTITAAAISACDLLDGVKDGVIANLDACKFDPGTLINTKANCTGADIIITAQDAEIAAKTWQGPRSSNGTFIWWGINPGAQFEGLTGTSCTGPVTNCTGNPFSITPDWILNWVVQNPSLNLKTITLGEFVDIFYEAYAEWNDIIGTNKPDLSAFNHNGGKMITWHGLADQLIYPSGTIAYYQSVQNNDPHVRNYYRFFPAPGVAHCGGGAGEVPSDPFDAVVDWVEKGLAPDTLPALSTDGTRSRNLCQYPLVSVFAGGDPTKASSFACKADF